MTRRQLLLFAGAGYSVQHLEAATQEFWEKKPPAEWTTEEIDRLITKSPWAKEESAEYAAPENGNGAKGAMPKIAFPGGVRNRGGGGGGRRGGTTSYKGIVRWESAAPILAAMKAPLPEQFAEHYVISVTGLPLFGAAINQANGEEPQRRPTEDDAYDKLKQFTRLEPHGRDGVQAGVVHRQVSSNASFLFGFSKETLQLTAADKEVIFSTNLGQLAVKAKFEIKDMLYHGELAI